MTQNEPNDRRRRCAYLPDSHTREIRSYNMSRIRSKNTKPEELVRHYLFSRGLRYRKNDKRYPGCPDIVLPKYHTVIFVNGCFWHMHIQCGSFIWPENNAQYWKEKILHNVERDRRNYEILTSMGWRIIIVWECELKKDLQLSRLEQLYNEIIQEHAHK